MKNMQSIFLDKLSGWFRGDEVKRTRWAKAQKYERKHWERLVQQIAEGSIKQLDWYKWKAKEMEKQLKVHLDQERKKSERILEIGSGPVGIISFLKYGERYAVDPLEDFYKTNAALCELRDSKVSYIKGTGECLPFDDDYFYLVIIDNVLDHVQNPRGVLDEIYRVLSSKGKLYLAVNVHTIWGGLLHSLLAWLKIDKGHPHTFTVGGIKGFIRERGFSILSEFNADYYDSRKRDRTSASFRDKMKGYSGLSDFIYSAVCVKRERMEHSLLSTLS